MAPDAGGVLEIDENIADRHVDEGDILRWARAAHICQRPPHEHVGDHDDPYMLRWFMQKKYRLFDTQAGELLRRFWCIEGRRLENAYVHRFIRSDEDHALHDHPWSWVTVLLDGSYWEHVPANPADPAGPTRRERRSAGDIVVRGNAARPHRVEITPGRPVTTLFLTAEKSREWGFWCERGWRHWRDFVAIDELGRTRLRVRMPSMRQSANWWKT